MRAIGSRRTGAAGARAGTSVTPDQDDVADPNGQDVIEVRLIVVASGPYGVEVDCISAGDAHWVY